MTNRREILKAAAGLRTLAAFGAPAALLPDRTVDADHAQLTHEAFGEIRIYFSGSTERVQALTVGSLLLKPGMSPQPPHQHPEEEVLLIAEATGEISRDGKTTAAGVGSVMYCAAGPIHGIVKKGRAPLLFYFFKWRKW
jgi:mannose-6-phosphate isomerase-like protein (cupin superfamily)